MEVYSKLPTISTNLVLITTKLLLYYLNCFFLSVDWFRLSETLLMMFLDLSIIRFTTKAVILKSLWFITQKSIKLKYFWYLQLKSLNQRPMNLEKSLSESLIPHFRFTFKHLRSNQFMCWQQVTNFAQIFVKHLLATRLLLLILLELLSIAYFNYELQDK